MSWQYFNFEQYWDQFLRCWKNEDIQELLYMDVIDFNISSGTYYPWQKGEPIWFLANTKFWDYRARCMLSEEIQRCKLISKFSTSFQNATSYKFKNYNDLESKFTEIVYRNMINDYYPKKDSIESLVLLGGNDATSYSMYSIAKLMFPNESVVYSFDEYGHQWVLIPHQNWVFDLEGYFMFHKANDPHYSFIDKQIHLNTLSSYNTMIYDLDDSISVDSF